MNPQLSGKLEKLRSGKLSEKERKKVLALFHEERLEYDLKQELFHQLEGMPDVDFRNKKGAKDMFGRLWKRIENIKERDAGRNMKINYLYRVAAILVICIFIGTLIYRNPFSSVKTGYYTAIAPKGSISETILPDGTTIFLNAGSKIRYATGKDLKNREVYMEGEVWFDVQKIKESTFLVHTPCYDIRVTGTKFNVKAYPEEEKIITTLEKGSIEIVSGDKLKLTNNIILKPGDQLVFNKNGKSLQVGHQVNVETFSAWKSNKLIFVNMSLGELVKLLERRYGVEITVSDQSLLNYHYDGTFKNETIVEVLNILQETLPVKYRIKNQTILIMKK